MLMTLERLKKHNLNVRGIYHIGAHKLEENNLYWEMGVPVSNILWFEANKDLCDEYQQSLAGTPESIRPKLYNIVSSDTDGDDVEFHVMNHRECSSIFKMKKHLQYTPYVNIQKTIIMKTVRMDTFIRDNNIDITAYNFINADVQGAELKVLKGFGDILNHIDYIYTEVNIAELYEGCALMNEIDDYLLPYGFKRVDIEMTPMEWGDAFYVKEKK